MIECLLYCLKHQTSNILEVIFLFSVAWKNKDFKCSFYIYIHFLFGSHNHTFFLSNIKDRIQIRYIESQDSINRIPDSIYRISKWTFWKTIIFCNYTSDKFRYVQTSSLQQTKILFHGFCSSSDLHRKENFEMLELFWSQSSVQFIIVCRITQHKTIKKGLMFIQNN